VYLYSFLVRELHLVKYIRFRLGKRGRHKSTVLIALSRLEDPSNMKRASSRFRARGNRDDVLSQKVVLVRRWASSLAVVS